ncbi:MAG: Secretion system C-terminal sorting domain [Bacteroidota bacterium]|jgi:hypothetical protein
MKNFRTTSVTNSNNNFSQSENKSRFGLLLKGLTLFFLLSTSDIFAQQLSMASCFATQEWTNGTYNQNTKRKIKVNGIYKVYKVVYASTAAPLTDRNNRCESSSGSCTRQWKFVGNCYSSMRVDSKSIDTNNEEDELEMIDISVYPNPFTSTLNVNTSVNSSTVEVSIFNLTGEKILSKTLISDNYQISTTFNTEFLANGIYIVKIIDGNEVFNYKVVK